MGNQWGDIYLCVSPTKMLGDVSPVPPIIAAPAWFLWFRLVSDQNGILVGLLASHGSSSCQTDRQTDKHTHTHTPPRSGTAPDDKNTSTGEVVYRTYKMVRNYSEIQSAVCFIKLAIYFILFHVRTV